MKEQPNVILLSIDALRADHLGYHGYDRDTSPFLDSLAEQSACFMTAISASSHTREAVPALLTGRYPDVFAANGYRLVGDSIADHLSAAGYATAAFHSNPYISRAYGYDSGFDTFDDDLLLGKHRLVALAQRTLNKFLLNKGDYHVRAADLNERSLRWLDSLDDEPFFLWNHYMDPHGPYNPPSGYTYTDRDLSNSDGHALYQKCIKQPEAITEAERQVLIDCYDGEIRYLDDHLSAFFDALATREVLEESLVIVTADHGDAFGEHGYFTHPRYLHEPLLHVPMLISLPENTAGATCSSPVSTLDIVPTILEYLDVPDENLPGTPLLDTADAATQRHDDIVFASATGEAENAGLRRFAARSSRWKVLLERDIESTDIIAEQAFDLHADAGEQAAVDTSDPRIAEFVERVRTFSASRLDAVNRTSLEASDEPTAEVEDRLEALGYK